MSESNSEELESWWKNGFFLLDSLSIYGDSKLNAEYNNAKSELDKWNESSIDEKAECIDFIYELTGGLYEDSLRSKFEKAQELSKKDILGKLINETYIGLGFAPSAGKSDPPDDLSPKNHAMTTMRFPVNLELRRSQHEEETVHRRADYWRDQVA